MATKLDMTSIPTGSRLGLKRQMGGLRVKEVTDTQKRSMAAVDNQRQSLAELAYKSLSKRQSLIQRHSRRSSLEDMDEQTLNTICEKFSDLLSGETTNHTAPTVSCSLEESGAPFFNGEESFTTFGEESFNMRRTSDFDVKAIDYDLQKEEMEKFEQQKRLNDGDDEDLIEVSPGCHLPLRGSEETWKAIMSGKVTITRCACCEEDLTCVEDAQLVVCCDCWVFSPVDQSIAGIPLEEETDEEWFTRNKSRGVGLGVKANDIIEWISSQQEAESS
jgi:hypothetical protein